MASGLVIIGALLGVAWYASTALPTPYLDREFRRFGPDAYDCAAAAGDRFDAEQRAKVPDIFVLTKQMMTFQKHAYDLRMYLPNDTPVDSKFVEQVRAAGTAMRTSTDAVRQRTGHPLLYPGPLDHVVE